LKNTPLQPITEVTMTTHTTQQLDHRSSNGLDVQLVWDPAQNRVAVIVDDTRTGESFEIEVGPGQNPLEVFRHPFAYLARRELAAAA
jgi:hypothetical protein